jgi:hypothetical protein
MRLKQKENFIGEKRYFYSFYRRLANPKRAGGKEKAAAFDITPRL